MRTATNHLGYQAEILTLFGWRAAGFHRTPYDTREEVQAAMDALSAAAPDREFRVYVALEEKSCG
jgi:hypothetical protein